MPSLNGSSRIQNHGPIGADRFRERAFFQGDRFAAAHELDVRDTDVRDDPGVRRGDLREGGDLPGMIHPDFPNRDLVLGTGRQNGLRKSDVIVEIAFRLRDAKSTRERRGDKIFRAGLAVAARDGDDLERQRSSVVRGHCLIADQGVGDANQSESLRRRALPILLDHRARRAAFIGLLDKLVAIEIFAAQRHKEIAGLQRARVGADPRDGSSFVAGDQ